MFIVTASAADVTLQKLISLNPTIKIKCWKTATAKKKFSSFAERKENG